MKHNDLLKISIFSFVLLLSFYGYAQPAYTPYSRETVSLSKNEVLDIGFYIKESMDNPFSVDFWAIFVGPDQEEIKVPGFYNGNKQWLLRFSGKHIGQWEYTSHSNVKALDGKKGKINVKEGAVDKRGAIQICDDDKQKFCYDDGTPYHLQAFELDWLFALDYSNEQAAPKSEHLIDLLARNGINQIVTTLYSYDINDKANDWQRDPLLELHPEHEFGGIDAIYPFLGTNENPDYSALNVTFFQRFDRIVSLMDKHDIIAHLMIYVWNKQVKWPDAESQADNMYFDYVIKRYQAFPNIIWDVSKEALNNERCTEEYGRERIRRIDSLDAYDRLITVHDYGFCKRNPDVVDFISTQDWSSTLYAEMLEIYEDYEKPVFNIEHGGYEISPYDVFHGDYNDPEVCLRRNYLCYFAGAYATYYWQGAAWNVIIYNPFEQNNDFAVPRFQYYKYLENFLTRLDYGKFEPYPSANGSGYCLKSKDDKTYLFYIPKENYKKSFYNKKVGPGKIGGTYQWFNTHTGDYTEKTKYEGGHLKSPWMDADAILIRNLL